MHDNKYPPDGGLKKQVRPFGENFSGFSLLVNLFNPTKTHPPTQDEVEVIPPHLQEHPTILILLETLQAVKLLLEERAEPEALIPAAHFLVQETLKKMEDYNPPEVVKTWKDTLEFYADHDNWYGTYTVGGSKAAMTEDWSDPTEEYPDGKPGKKAREALLFTIPNLEEDGDEGDC